LAEYLARLVVLILLVVGLMLFDVPLVLAGEFSGLVLDALGPNAVSLTERLKAFLQGGGRIALALTASLLSVLFVGRMGGVYRAGKNLTDDVEISMPGLSKRRTKLLSLVLLLRHCRGFSLSSWSFRREKRNLCNIKSNSRSSTIGIGHLMWM
jgi:hypothetical protein